MSILSQPFLNIGAKLRHWLPAQPCLLCGAASHDGLCCAPCLRELPHLGKEHCPVCALPSPGGQVCGHCLREPPPYSRTFAAFRYGFPLDRLIQAFKFHEHLALATLFADAIAARITERPEALVPMPLHPARLRERGFNQSQLLAQALARRLGIAVLPVAERVRDTAPQSSLPWAGRQRNLRGAFRCTRPLHGMQLALVDDVMTSGASLGELARALQGKGAGEIQAWVVARTLPP